MKQTNKEAIPENPPWRNIGMMGIDRKIKALQIHHSIIPKFQYSIGVISGFSE